MITGFKRFLSSPEQDQKDAFCIYPQDGLLSALEADYEAMRRMIFGEVPEFKWILEQMRIAEDIVNRR